MNSLNDQPVHLSGIHISIRILGTLCSVNILPQIMFRILVTLCSINILSQIMFWMV